MLGQENSTANASPADVDVGFGHSQSSGTERLLLPFQTRTPIHRHAAHSSRRPPCMFQVDGDFARVDAREAGILLLI